MSAFTVKATGAAHVSRVDTAEVKRALGVLVDPEHGVELRALPSARFFVGEGGNLDRLAVEATKLGDEAGLYFTLNPIPANLNRRPLKEHVIKRRWFLLDFDRRKTEADKDLSATEAEKEAARTLAETVVEWLGEQGWPIPLFIDSGNGFHALYRIDLPNTDATQSLLRESLYALGKKFDTAAVEIDKSVHNASRISKLPGSFVRKGPSSDERPHRPALLLHVPGEIAILTAEQIAATTAALAPDDATVTPSTNGVNGHAPKRPNLLTARAAGTGDGRAYAARALEYELLKVRMAAPGNRNNVLNRAAFSMATLAAGGGILWNQCKAELEFAARGVGLDDPEIQSTLNSAWKAGSQKPRQAPERNGTSKPSPAAQSATAGEGQSADTPQEWQFTLDGEVIAEGKATELSDTSIKVGDSKPVLSFDLFSLPAILTAHFPEPNWVVPGILSEGLNILAGKPKLGKSMLALNLGMTIAGGGTALKQIKVDAGDVLYLALEDTARRIQTRARLMVKGMDCETSGRLKIATRWPKQTDGGLKMMELWMRHSERPTLVIIDVWGKFRPNYRTQGSQYEQDYQHMGEVKEFLDANRCNSLVLMHCRKAAAEDALEEVSGTMGLTGAADGIVVLSRSRNNDEAKILVTGRDVQETELALRFDKATLTWTSLGSSEEHLTGTLQIKVLNYLKSLNSTPAFASQISEALEEENGSVRKILHKLFDKRLVRRHGKAWVYPGEEDEEAFIP